MKVLHLIIIGLICSNLSFGQVSLTPKETEVLKEICENYYKSLKEGNLKKLQKKSPERFHGFIGQMIAIKSKNKTVLEKKYLKKPTYDELMFWYVVREIHYNRSEEDESAKKTVDEIISKVTKEEVDSRWLLDNYYYRLSNSLMMYFNNADLSKLNFDINELGFADETEKAIFFFFMINHCEGRVRVLNFTGKGNPLDFITKLPKINGKEYFYYQNFDYEDFDWIGHKEVESYNTRHIGNYYSILLTHLNKLIEKKDFKKAIELFNNSILSNPELFKYSSSEEFLKGFYKENKR